VKINIVQGAFLPVPPLRGGAVEKIWYALGKEFARRGHEITHISRTFGDLPQEERIHGVRHIRVGGFDAPKSLVLLKCLDLVYSVRALNVLPPADVIVTNTFWLPMLIRSQRFGRLYVHVARYPRGQMHFYGHAARLQTVSEVIKDAIIEEVPDLANAVECIPNPLPEVTPFDKIAVNGQRERYLLYVGRVHPEKGLDLLISAISLIPAELFAGWRLLIVGPAEARAGGGGENYLNMLKKRTEPIRDRIEWVGPVYDSAKLAAYYRQSSLFLYPSLAERGETFGLAPLEAMSHGCPALVSDLACFRDFIVQEENGFVFDHRAMDAVSNLARSIARLISDAGIIDRVREAALSRSQDFALDRIADRYLKDFQAVWNPCPAVSI